MNFKSINFDSKIIAFGLPLLIVLFAVSLSMTSFLTVYPELAVGVTYDLTLSVPLLYLVLIRKTKIPKLTAIPVFVFGVLTASLILPADNRFHLGLIQTWLLPAVEAAALIFFGIKAYKAYQTYQTLSGKSSDVLEILRETCRKYIFPAKFAEIAAFEMAVVYFAVFSRKTPPRANAFTYHKKSGTTALFSVVLFIIAIETAVVHILVALWSETLAWILTIASVYLLLQIYAHLKAVRQRPVEVVENRLFLRYGLFGDAVTELENIESVDNASAPIGKGKGVKKLALLGDLEQHNMKIKFRKEIVFKGFYGIRSKAETLYLYIDEIEGFKRSISKNDLEKN